MRRHRAESSWAAERRPLIAADRKYLVPLGGFSGGDNGRWRRLGPSVAHRGCLSEDRFGRTYSAGSAPDQTHCPFLPPAVTSS